MEAKEKEAKSPIEAKIDEVILNKRRIFLSTGVDEESALDVIRKLWYLEEKEPGKPILLVINSPGGSVHAGFAVWDQIMMISSPVTTLVTGLAASMGSLLSLAAAPGRRFATPNARLMVHQPAIHGVVQGQATDLEIQAKEIMRTRDKIVQIYVQATGKDPEEMEKILDRDTWVNAEEAVKFGLLDGVMSSYQDLTM